MTKPEGKKCYSCNEIIPVGDACCADCVGKVVEHYIADTKAKVLELLHNIPRDECSEVLEIRKIDWIELKKRIEAI